MYDKHKGRLRVFQNHSSLNDFYGTFLPGFLWPIILIYLVLNPYLVYLRILPYVHMHLSEHRFYLRGLWIVSITSLLTSKDPFYTMHAQLRRSPDFENEKQVVSYLLSLQDSASSLHCPAIFVFSTGPQRMSSNYLLRGPIYLLPQEQWQVSL